MSKVRQLQINDLPDFAWLGLMIDQWDRIESGVEERYGRFTGDHGSHTELWKIRQFKRKLKKVKQAARAHLCDVEFALWVELSDRVTELSDHRNKLVHGRWVAFFDEKVGAVRRVRIGLPEDWYIATDILIAWGSQDPAETDRITEYIYDVVRIRDLCIEMDDLVSDLFIK